jgi:glutamate-1-semialdehyde 2,1-aminomutase
MAKIVKRKTQNENRKIFNQAKKYLVGGVNSPVRSFSYVGTGPVLAKKGEGAYIWDYDNNKYIDYVQGFGALILGHSHPEVIKDLKETINSGLSFGLTNEKEIQLAKIIKNAIPFVGKIRFVNSGTEAVMSAIRLARGYTQRDKIVKFENSYHGHADYLLAKGGSGLATLKIAQSAGVPKDFIKHTLIAPFGDSDALLKIFGKYGKNIAAVIVEPVGANSGVVLPDISFLRILRQITKQHGALLIFDEVITGFRFNFGSVSERFAVVPDLICLGKIMGGGLAIGAYGGSNKIMSKLAPNGDVYQASTFSGNPVVMQSGISTLNVLKRLKDDYVELWVLTDFLVSGIEKEASKIKISLKINHYKNMFSFRFEDKKQFQKFYKLMLAQRILFAPSEFEANFLSFAHDKKDIMRTLTAVSRAFSRLK